MPLLLAGGEVEGGDSTFSNLQQFWVITDRAARDHNEVAYHRWSTPRIVFQGSSPLDVSSLGVQTHEGPIPSPLLVQVGAGNQDALAGDGHRRIHVPFPCPLLPNLYRRRLG